MNRIPLLVVIALSLVLSAIVAATAPVGAGEKARQAAAVAPVDDAWRAALPRDPEAATKAYLARLSPEARERSDSYFEGKQWLKLWSPLLSVAVLWLLLGTRCSAAMRDLAERFTRVRALQTLLYVLLFVALTWLIGLPLDVYTDYFREHQYGLSTQSFWPWFGEQLTSLLLSMLLTSALMIAIYAVIRRAPRTWWLWGSGVSLVFLVFVILIGPVYIDPLFNTYKPLPDGVVKESILSLARANAVPVDNVYEFDASKQTTRVSANVSGFLGTTAVRLNDNLLKRTSLPEIRAVMAHEIGHYALNHIYKLLVIYGIIFVAGFAFVRWGFAWAQDRWGERWGVRGVGDTAGLPLFMAVFTVYFFLVAPALTTVIRAQEVEADLFGVNAAREADGFAEAGLKLSEYRKVDPGPIEEFILFDHPSPRNRIFAAMRWKAEQGK